MKEYEGFTTLTDLLNFQSLTYPFLRHGWQAVPSYQIDNYFKEVSNLFTLSHCLFTTDLTFIDKQADLRSIFDLFFRPGIKAYIQEKYNEPESCSHYVIQKYGVAFQYLYNTTQDVDAEHRLDIRNYNDLSATFLIFGKNLTKIQKTFNIQNHERKLVEFLIMVTAYIQESNANEVKELSAVTVEKLYSGCKDSGGGG